MKCVWRYNGVTEVVRDFVKRVKEGAMGVEVSKSLTPGQEFIKIVQAELGFVMGESNEALDLTRNRQPLS
ncbi:hypothetical protein O9929_07635 [Vibrio lentus]|nr:hypothetical protein [Vibrio lentus]